GTLNSIGSTQFRIEFFANDACHPSGFGEGKTFLGAATLTTDSSCLADFTGSNAIVVFSSGATGQVITATATDPAGNTSEFSQCITAMVTTPSHNQYITSTSSHTHNT